MPRASFVIATYLRTTALACTLRSLLLQDEPDWEAIVVGDRCPEETAEVIRSLGDPRIRYYNLPQRCGEQSGPNSFGLHVARGDSLAFLNHDDLLLADHLSNALHCGADLYLGRFADARRVEATGNCVAPVFDALYPEDDDLSRLLSFDAYAFDPSSFWLIRTAYARRVGPWRPARQLWRTPLQDWLLRAWRAGGRIVLGERLTGLRILTHNLQKAGQRFQHPTPGVETLIRRLENAPADAIRNEILEGIGSEPTAGSRRRWLRPRRLAAALYLRTGIDAQTAIERARLRARGEVLEDLSMKRLGRPLPPPVDLAPLLRDPESWRVV